MDPTKLCTLKDSDCERTGCDKCGWNARVAEARKDAPYVQDDKGLWRKKVGGK